MKTKIKNIIILLIILNSSFLILNLNAQWEPDVILILPNYASTSDNNAWCIAGAGNVVDVVYMYPQSAQTYISQIFRGHSTNGGTNWNFGQLSNSQVHAGSPSMAISGSLVHVVWYDFRNGNNEIYYTRYIAGQMNMLSDIRLTNDSADSYYPSIAGSDSLVHVVWMDFRDGNYEIYYKRSHNSGASWGSDIRLTNNTAGSSFPSVAVSGSNVHVVWFDGRDGIPNNEIYYKHSTDGGINWEPDTRLTNNTAWSAYPSIAVSGSTVHVVWYDTRDGNREIYYKRSTDNGINWESDKRLTNNTALSLNPSIAVSGSLVHVVWQDERDGNFEIYYKLSTNGGINWNTDTRLTNNTEVSRNPSVAVSGSQVHVVWTNNGLYYKRNPSGNLTGIQNISTEIPSVYTLKQNYPNPFNPRTVIRYQVPAVSNVILKVYDINGKEVQMLVNEKLQPGTYETSFDGSMLTSGVYFYKMTAGNYSETKRMVLIK